MEITRFSFLKNLSELSFVDAIVLYGSRARGDHHDRSDIDLAIVCPAATDQNWFQVLDIIEKADTLLKIDCVRLDTLSANNTLRASIKKDGIYLYKKEKKK